MNKQHRLKELIILFQEGNCSEEELQELKDFLRETDAPHILEEVYDVLPDVDTNEPLNTHKTEILSQIFRDERVQKHTSTASAATRHWRWKSPLTAVAAVLLFAMVALLYKHLILPTGHKQWTENELVQRIVPGSDRARIILDDGTEIDLEKISGDTVIVQNGFSITKGDDGMITYSYHDGQALAQNTVYNTVVTPKGGQYQVALSDGTRVWLNAGSKLRYPVSFNQDQRNVELEGEGYFEVVRQEVNGRRVPFTVRTGTQQLEVIGTKFNVHAYSTAIKTTLIEGKVRVGMGDNGQRVTLKPSEQAVLNPQVGQFDIKKVDPIYAMAWKDGNFAFRKADIKEVMESVSRWYDVEVAYETNIGHSQFTGTISRSEEIEALLKRIELTGSVHFAIEGRRVIVKP